MLIIRYDVLSPFDWRGPPVASRALDVCSRRVTRVLSTRAPIPALIALVCAVVLVCEVLSECVFSWRLPRHVFSLCALQVSVLSPSVLSVCAV